MADDEIVEREVHILEDEAEFLGLGAVEHLEEVDDVGVSWETAEDLDLWVHEGFFQGVELVLDALDGDIAHSAVIVGEDDHCEAALAESFEDVEAFGRRGHIIHFCVPEEGEIGIQM